MLRQAVSTSVQRLSAPRWGCVCASSLRHSEGVAMRVSTFLFLVRPGCELSWAAVAAGLMRTVALDLSGRIGDTASREAVD